MNFKIKKNMLLHFGMIQYQVNLKQCIYSSGNKNHFLDTVCISVGEI